MEQKFCTNCGAKLSPGAIFCDNCGSKVEDDAKQATAVTDDSSFSSHNQEFCDNCGAKLSSGAEFCDNCGHKIGDNTESNVGHTLGVSDSCSNKHNKTKKKSRKTWKIVIGVIVAAIVAIFIGFQSGYFQKQYIINSANKSGLGKISKVDIDLNKKTAYFVLTDEGEKEYGKELDKAISADDPDEHLPMENATGQVVQNIIDQQKMLGPDWTVSVSTRQPNTMLIGFRNGKETQRFQETDDGQELIEAAQDEEGANEIAGAAGELYRAFYDGFNGKQ
ncbi:zinc-ribbon domain-containing protein [Ligilactobacillus saerimneri]|uniref:zinc ribbon domain-containing protein n=1 Tax=Ligilactobacillus saerimneri TaxID=228229 RepID=UPI0022A698B7|nr:zinc-ribbon domain-containing protein [Ligilactobacillus saerimneri]MCZ0891709.1 zinc-ribbon domain-containing protein [Ligilactobacillus saerimneri]